MGIALWWYRSMRGSLYGGGHVGLVACAGICSVRYPLCVILCEESFCADNKHQSLFRLVACNKKTTPTNRNKATKKPTIRSFHGRAFIGVSTGGWRLRVKNVCLKFARDGKRNPQEVLVSRRAEMAVLCEA
ncbi:hypothetical protein E2C01_089529 [Portunus trituberculatus]|uniref:Uncharacterized protein n=1 Tax=Portunus trituberculatus TaxID=210409 RepID=A0A5B7JDS6_PORTR|nr:hypothetical protein [Portunus trituberculatus]